MLNNAKIKQLSMPDFNESQSILIIKNKLVQPARQLHNKMRYFQPLDNSFNRFFTVRVFYNQL